MRAFYWRPPDEAELSLWRGSKTAADFPEPVIEVWEDNWEVLSLFRRNCDQWRVGPNGPFGLDLNVIYTDMAVRNVLPARQEQLLQQLILVKDAALEVLRQ